MRVRLRMPSHTTVAAYLALFIAMSGTAYATTGGTFVLGKRNTAGSMTKLRNPNGTPLKLVPRAGYAPLRVTSTTRVANLNADRLDGFTAADFLAATGKAANSDTLDGLDSSAFLRAESRATDSSRLGGLDAAAYLTGSETASDSFRLGGLLPSSYQRALSGGAVLAQSFCPVGTFQTGTVQVTGIFGSASTWKVCAV